MRLFLCAPHDEWDRETEERCVAPMSGWPFYKEIEAAGEAHLELVIRRSQGIFYEEIVVETTVEVDEDDNDSGDDEPTLEQRAKYAQRRAQKKQIHKEADYYELLGLGHLRWSANDKDIKKAYRKMVLNHHPDKQAQAKDEVNDDMFKLITKAYECLSNPEKRRFYDSHDNSIDDTIPSEAHAQTGDFFRTFTAVFDINSRWSSDPDVPSLGTEEDSYEYALKFYDFWRNFKSWREFDAGEEGFDTEIAECREEKRWMERQNKKITNKLKKSERQRIMTLVDRAYRYDPRILKFKEEREAERERKKMEKKLLKQKKREEEERLAKEKQAREEEEKRKQEEEAKQQAIQNKQIRKKRPQFRKVCRAARDKHLSDKRKYPFNPIEEHVEVLCKLMNLQQFNKTLKAFSSGDGSKLFREMLVEYSVISADDPYFETEQSSEVIVEQPKKVEDDSASQKSKPWTPEEITSLTKALTKYPVGTRNRYQLVSDFLGGKRTVKEIIAQTNIGKSETAAQQSMTKQDAFERFKETKKEAKVTKVVEPTIVAQPSVEKKTKQPSPKPAPKSEPKQTTATTTSNPEDWSPEEQKLLEAAMKKFTSKEGDRWNKIASEIPNRSKAECVARYKFLVEFFKQQRQKRQ